MRRGAYWESRTAIGIIGALLWMAVAASCAQEGDGGASSDAPDAANAADGAAACEAPDVERNAPPVSVALAECGVRQMPTVEGTCVAVGPASCPDGFRDDGDEGCTPVVDACAEPGTVRLVDACVPVLPAGDACPTQAYTELAASAGTVFVDASVQLSGDGSADAPYAYLEDALEDGAVAVAVAAGDYEGVEATVAAGDVVVQGACPGTTRLLVDDGDVGITVQDGASLVLGGVTVEGGEVGIAGEPGASLTLAASALAGATDAAIAVRGAELAAGDVVLAAAGSALRATEGSSAALERVRVDGAGNPGVDVDASTLVVTDSEIAGVVGVAVQAGDGAEVELLRTLVRDNEPFEGTLDGAPITFGSCVVVRAGGEATITDSVLARCARTGVATEGRAEVVGSTISDSADVAAAFVAEPPASIEVRGSTLRFSSSFAVVSQGGDMTLADDAIVATEVAGVSPPAAERTAVVVAGSLDPSHATVVDVRGCSIEANAVAGIDTGSDPYSESGDGAVNGRIDTISIRGNRVRGAAPDALSVSQARAVAVSGNYLSGGAGIGVVASLSPGAAETASFSANIVEGQAWLDGEYLEAAHVDAPVPPTGFSLEGDGGSAMLRDNIIAIDLGHGIGCLGGVACTVEGNRVRLGSAGGQGAGLTMTCNGGAGGRIARNAIDVPGGQAVWIWRCADVAVEDNDLLGGVGGLFACDCDQLSLVGNRLSASSPQLLVGALALRSVGEASMRGDIIAGTGGTGVILSASAATLTDVVVADNASGGVLVIDGADVTLEGANTLVSANQGYGLDCANGSLSLTDGAVRGQRQAFDDTGGYGLVVREACAATLQGVELCGNATADILVADGAVADGIPESAAVATGRAAATPDAVDSLDGFVCPEFVPGSAP